MSRYVIVGNGVAGNAAAETLRKLEPESEIRMFTREGHFYYYRPALPEYLAGKSTSRPSPCTRGLVREEPDRGKTLPTEIVDIRLAEKTVAGFRRESAAYDRLLLGHGRYAVVPKMPGNDLEGVFTCTRLPMPMP